MVLISTVSPLPATRSVIVESKSCSDSLQAFAKQSAHSLGLGGAQVDGVHGRNMVGTSLGPLFFKPLK